MKAGKYRELFSKIDTNKSVDEKIKNELLYHETDEKKIRKVSYNDYNTNRKGRWLFRGISKIVMIKPALPSLAFLVVFVIIIMSTRNHLLYDNVTPGTDAAYSAEITPEAIASAVTSSSDHIESPSSDTTDTLIADITEETSDEISQPPADNITENLTEGETGELSEGTEESTIVNTTEDTTNDTTATEEVITENVTADEVNDNMDQSIETITNGDFYFAWFDVINENGVKAAIPNLIIRLHGTVDSIDPNDLTDIVLTRDAVPVSTGITLTDRVEQYEWRYEKITDFYFKFDTENREPGIYGLTGKYKGVPFDVYNKIIEANITDESAHAEDLTYIGIGGYTDKNDNYIKLSEVVFGFKGLQNSFYTKDLTDLKITCNNEEIPFSYMDDPFRYYEATSDNLGETSFNLILDEPFTKPGTYVVTGKYQGTPFTSYEIVIP